MILFNVFIFFKIKSANNNISDIKYAIANNKSQSNISYIISVISMLISIFYVAHLAGCGF